MSANVSTTESNPHVDRELDRLLRELEGSAREFDIGSSRIVIASDHHRGARNSADSFQAAEDTYAQAMRSYLEREYLLVTLGDVEELWEERPENVVEAYAHSLRLEAEFHRAGRYVRVWGNHDDEWKHEDALERHLRPVYGGEPLETAEGALFRVRDGDEELGRLLLVHGHQGSLKSDRWAGVSEVLVRRLYRPLQRLVGLSLDTPSKNPRLQTQHSTWLRSWAKRQDRVVLVAGHTHRPVFEGHDHAAPSDDTQEKNERERVDHARAEAAARYFNSGCCCYPNGDITVLELADGEIRLVRWRAAADAGDRKVIARDSLRHVFEALS